MIKQNLISGFQDATPLSNIASNGQFRIDQRNTYEFKNQLTEGSYLCDMWKAETLAVDICYAVFGGGYVAVSGTGKKGQYIILRNIDYGENIGYNFYEPDTVTMGLTSSVDVRCDQGNASVETSPRYRNTTGSIEYTLSPVIKEGDTKRAVMARRTHAHAFDKGGYVRIDLLSDGEFDFKIFNFMELVGLYRNPPSFSGVAYADDFYRCQRYFQEFTVAQVNPITRDAVKNLVHFNIQLPTIMAGVPTLTMTAAGSFFMRDSNTAGSGISSDDVLEWNLIGNPYASRIQVLLQRGPGGSNPSTVYNLLESNVTYRCEI